MKSRICVNALALRTGGGLSYAAELIPELQRLHGAQCTRVLVNRAQSRTLGWSSRAGVIVLPNAFSYPPLRFAFENVVLPLALIVWRCRSVLMCGNLGLLFCPARQVLVQHASFSAAQTPQGARWKLRWQLVRFLSWMSARSADRVVYVSAALQNELGVLGFPRGRVIRHGVNALFRPVARDSARSAVLTKYGINTPYLLCVADIYAHKNLALAIDVLAALRKDLPTLALVIAGAPRDAAEVLRLEQLAARLGVQSHVHMVGRMPREALVNLYNAAECVLVPSTAESFGMPLLEALACGVPVACSRIPAFDEVAENAGFYFDPRNPAEATAQVLVARAVDRPYRIGIDRAASFTWEAAAALTLNTLMDAEATP